jgi:hypothetical protein
MTFVDHRKKQIKPYEQSLHTWCAFPCLMNCVAKKWLMSLLLDFDVCATVISSTSLSGFAVEGPGCWVGKVVFDAVHGHFAGGPVIRT